MSAPTVFRVYAPEECSRKTGYPHAWTVIDPLTVTDAEWDAVRDRIGDRPRFGIKDLVREDAGHRCVRCQHPYRVGVDGIMEPVTLDVRRLADDLSIDVRSLELGLELEADQRESLDDLDLSKVRRTHWSPCNQECRHSGPVRLDHGDGRGWIEPGPGFGEKVTDVHFAITDVGVLVQASWRILTVHHLDGIKTNCRWWNLAALCQRCHLQVQGKVQMERVWPWEHSEWFQPYVAGFYAWTYLREDLTRDEIEPRLDELLALERAA